MKRLERLRRGDIVRMKRGEHLISGWNGFGVVVSDTSGDPDEAVDFMQLDEPLERIPAMACRYQLVRVRGLPRPSVG